MGCTNIRVVMVLVNMKKDHQLAQMENFAASTTKTDVVSTMLYLQRCSKVATKLDRCHQINGNKCLLGSHIISRDRKLTCHIVNNHKGLGPGGIKGTPPILGVSTMTTVCKEDSVS